MRSECKTSLLWLSKRANFLNSKSCGGAVCGGVCFTHTPYSYIVVCGGGAISGRLSNGSLQIPALLQPPVLNP